jgi:hypothetical protein
MVEKTLFQKLMTANRVALLEKVKTRMEVDPLCNLEAQKESFKTHNSVKLDFGKWLVRNIFQQKLWTDYKMDAPKGKGEHTHSFHTFNNITTTNLLLFIGKELPRENFINFVKEDKYIKIASVLDEMQPKIFNGKVHNILLEKPNVIFKISDFIEALHQIVSYFSDNFPIENMESAVYMFFIDLHRNECTEELYRIIGSTQTNDHDLNFKNRPNLEISSLKNMCNYSYFIINRYSENFICQLVLHTLIKDFQKKFKFRDSIKPNPIKFGNLAKLHELKNNEQKFETRLDAIMNEKSMLAKPEGEETKSESKDDKTDEIDNADDSFGIQVSPYYFPNNKLNIDKLH